MSGRLLKFCEAGGGACRATTCPPSRTVAQDGAPLALHRQRSCCLAGVAGLLGKAGEGRPLASVMRVGERVKDKPAAPVLRILDPLRGGGALVVASRRSLRIVAGAVAGGVG